MQASAGRGIDAIQRWPGLQLIPAITLGPILMCWFSTAGRWWQEMRHSRLTSASTASRLPRSPGGTTPGTPPSARYSQIAANGRLE